MLMRDLKSDLETAVDYQNETEEKLDSLWWDNLQYTVKEGVVTVGTGLTAGAAAGAMIGVGNIAFFIVSRFWKISFSCFCAMKRQKQKTNFIGKVIIQIARKSNTKNFEMDNKMILTAKLAS